MSTLVLLQCSACISPVAEAFQTSPPAPEPEHDTAPTGGGARQFRASIAAGEETSHPHGINPHGASAAVVSRDAAGQNRRLFGGWFPWKNNVESFAPVDEEVVPFVDVSLFNDEISMLNYRLRLHASFADHFVIVESNVTFSGDVKRVHAHTVTHAVGLPVGKRTGISIVHVPLSPDGGNERSRNFARATFQRIYVINWLRDHFPRHRVFFSDVDELLDIRALFESNLMLKSDCIRPNLRSYYYSEHCPMVRSWDKSVIFRTDGRFFKHAAATQQVEMRATDSYVQDHCPVTSEYMGWHFSYAMSTEAILMKLSTFEHAQDKQVREVCTARNATALLNDRIRLCQDLTLRKGNLAGLQLSAFDGRVPQLSGWPRNEAAP